MWENCSLFYVIVFGIIKKESSSLKTRVNFPSGCNIIVNDFEKDPYIEYFQDEI